MGAEPDAEASAARDSEGLEVTLPRGLKPRSAPGCREEGTFGVGIGSCQARFERWEGLGDRGGRRGAMTTRREGRHTGVERARERGGGRSGRTVGEGHRGGRTKDAGAGRRPVESGPVILVVGIARTVHHLVRARARRRRRLARVSCPGVVAERRSHRAGHARNGQGGLTSRACAGVSSVGESVGESVGDSRDARTTGGGSRPQLARRERRVEEYNNWRPIGRYDGFAERGR